MWLLCGRPRPTQGLCTHLIRLPEPAFSVWICCCCVQHDPRLCQGLQNICCKPQVLCNSFSDPQDADAELWLQNGYPAGSYRGDSVVKVNLVLGCLCLLCLGGLEAAFLWRLWLCKRAGVSWQALSSQCCSACTCPECGLDWPYLALVLALPEGPRQSSAAVLVHRDAGFDLPVLAPVQLRAACMQVPPGLARHVDLPAGGWGPGMKLLGAVGAVCCRSLAPALHDLLTWVTVPAPDVDCKSLSPTAWWLFAHMLP